jgi:predicted PurR-regulated permease PerM
LPGRWKSGKGGGTLFDLAGVLLAIPMITVFKVFVSSTARQLKAYGLIEWRLISSLSQQS